MSTTCTCGSTNLTAARTESGAYGEVCNDCLRFFHTHRDPAGEGICNECRSYIYPARTA